MTRARKTKSKPLKKALRNLTAAASGAIKAGELGATAAQVIAARSMAAAAGLRAGKIDHREMTRMVTEKAEAMAYAGLGLAAFTARMAADWGRLWMAEYVALGSAIVGAAQMQHPGSFILRQHEGAAKAFRRASAASADLAATILDGQQRVMWPFLRATRANVARLSR